MVNEFCKGGGAQGCLKSLGYGSIPRENAHLLSTKALLELSVVPLAVLYSLDWLCQQRPDSKIRNAATRSSRKLLKPFSRK